MIVHKNGSDRAVIILHEIYGINPHIVEVCDRYSNSGYDVYCPNLIHKAEPFEYSQQQAAYDHFKTEIGFDVHIKLLKLLEELRTQYRAIFLVGYSIGATIAWRCSAFGVCDGVIGYYGSRIRDYLEIVPKCPVLLIFAEQEPSFAPHDLVLTPEQQKNTSMVIFAGEHGFCDRFSSHYNSESFIKAQMLTNTFIEDIKKRN
ncbi:putative hydrolase [Oscillibacter valericigenes Sjm18-20]|nr:putative hydrolase [Oscillibacter valericigenes Sjm18-20]